MNLLAGAVLAAVRFLALAWRAAWAALLLSAVLMVATSARIEGAPIPGSTTAWLLAATAVSLIARGGLWRLALGQGRPGPGGLQIGAVEARLAAVWALSGVFLSILALLVFVGLLCFAYAAASAGRGFDPMNVVTWAKAVDDRGRALVSGAAAIGAGGLIYAATRISMAEAASVALGRVQVLSTWRLSHRRVTAIAGTNLLVAAFPAALFITKPLSFTRGVWTTLWPLASGVVLAWVWLPMSVGLMAYVYRRCAAPQADQ